MQRKLGLSLSVHILLFYWSYFARLTSHVIQHTLHVNLKSKVERRTPAKMVVNNRARDTTESP